MLSLINIPKMKKSYIIFCLFAVISQTNYKEISSNIIPKNCYKEDFDVKSNTPNRWLTCTIKRNSRLDFNVSKDEMEYISGLSISPDRFDSKTILTRKSMDFNSLIQHLHNNKSKFWLLFRSIKGFDLDLFDMTNYSPFSQNTGVPRITISDCDFDFFIRGKKMRSCQDYYDNMTNSYLIPKSIFQMSLFLEKALNQIFILNLSGFRNPICPLAFKNVFLINFLINGFNTYFSQRLLRFTNDTFEDLNSFVFVLQISISNVELNLEFLNPSVFEKLKVIIAYGKIKSIDPNVFVALTKLTKITFESDYVKGLMHDKRGIEWIKNINKQIIVNLSNQTEMNQNLKSVKYLYLSCLNMIRTTHPSDIFPEEDFCLYKDFPFKQLVLLVQTCITEAHFDYFRQKLSCTYLWLIQYYSHHELYINYINENFEFIGHITKLIRSKEFKSMSRCGFERRIEMCNRTNFEIKPVITYFEIKETMIMIETVLNIVSYPLSIFGILTNLFIIITISNKKNKEDFKGIKQYSYLRINSICSCLILIIHFFSWLNDCFYPYQVFCSEARKTFFLQYVKMLIVEVFGTSLKFMNNFTYIAFAFNRISLIGKDHNKLVKFMSDVGIKKYTAVCLLISIGLSSVKYFSYRLNYGKGDDNSYPIEYNINLFYDIGNEKKSTIYFTFNFVSDLLNYLVFLLIHLSIDIGMIVKLRQTLNEKFEKAKVYSTKDQQEKKKKENETAVNKAISMVILNTALNIIFKVPSLIYSIIDFYESIYRLDYNYFLFHGGFGRFYMGFCNYAYFCHMFLRFSDILFLISISIQLFFFVHFDKKFKFSFYRIFFPKKK